jgi:putative polyketide hydroxylase
VLRLDPSLGKENLMPIVDEATVELGYRQLSNAIQPETADDGALWENPREPTARPGMRAPHLPVDRGGKASSLLDLFGDGFVLLAAEGGSDWEEAAARLDVPVTTYRAGVDFRDDARRFAELYGTGERGATLVRPDGFVAWRTQGAPESEGDALADALAAALARR